MTHRCLRMLVAAVICVALAEAAAAETLVGRWRLLSAEDLRTDGSVARYPWGQHPVGSIVAEAGACYVQIMSSDTPTFSSGATLSSVIGPKPAPAELASNTPLSRM